MPRLETDIREAGHIILLSVVPPAAEGEFRELRDPDGKEYAQWVATKIHIFGIRTEHKRQIIGEHPELLEQYVHLDTSDESHEGAVYSLVNCVGSVEIAEGVEYPVMSFAEIMTET